MAGIKQISATTIAPTNRPKKVRRARVKNQDKWFLKYLDEKLQYTKKWTTKDVFYPSMLGNVCDRYLYLAYNGQLPEQVITAKTARIFDTGSSLEERMKKYFTRTGLFIAAEQSVRLANPPISGRYDFLLKHEEHGRVMLELKSINQKGFEALIEAPKGDHLIQLQIYLNLAEVAQGIVLYENKNDQTLKAFIVTQDKSIWNAIIERCIRIQNMTPEEMPKTCTGEFFCACRGVK